MGSRPCGFLHWRQPSAGPAGWCHLRVGQFGRPAKATRRPAEGSDSDGAAWADYVSFCEWEYYQPPEAVLQRTLRLLVDADAAKVVVVAGMFGMGKSSLARHIACNPDKLQKVNF